MWAQVVTTGGPHPGGYGVGHGVVAGSAQSQGGAAHPELPLPSTLVDAHMAGGAPPGWAPAPLPPMQQPADPQASAAWLPRGGPGSLAGHAPVPPLLVGQPMAGGRAARAGSPRRGGTVAGKQQVQQQPPVAKKPCPSQLFRQRQKAMISDLERQVQEKLQQLESLREQNQELRQKGSVLQAAVTGRDDQIRIISLGSSSSSRGSDPPDDTGGALPAGDLCGVFIGGPCAAAAAAVPAAAPAAAERAAAVSGPGYPSRPGDSGTACDAASAGGHQGLSGSAAAAPEARGGKWWQRDGSVAAGEVRATTVEDVRQLMREFVGQVSPELLAAQHEEGLAWDGGAAGGASGGGAGTASGDGRGGHQGSSAAAAGAGAQGQWGAAAAASGDAMLWDGSALRCAGSGSGGGSFQSGSDGGELGGGALATDGSFSLFGSSDLPPAIPPGSARARVHALVNRYLGAVKHIYLLAPHTIIPLMGTNMETGGPMQQGPALDGLWRGVVAGIGLSEQQRLDILALHPLHARYVGRLMAERVQLQAQLDAAHQAVGSDALKSAGAAAGIVAGSATTLAMDAADKLAGNMKKVEAVRALLYYFVFQHVLTPLQMARMSAHVYPMLGDVCSLAHVVWQDAGLAVVQGPAQALQGPLD